MLFELKETKKGRYIKAGNHCQFDPEVELTLCFQCKIKNQTSPTLTLNLFVKHTYKVCTTTYKIQ